MSYNHGRSGRYSDRHMPAKRALEGALEDGCRVFIGGGCGEPRHLASTLVEMLPGYRDVEIVQNVSMGELPEDWSGLAGHARLRTYFVGPKSRSAVHLGYGDYVPMYFSSIPKALKSDGCRPDICLLQVSPPDESGFCSLGVSVAISKTAAECSGMVIAQVNPFVPRTLGDGFIHESRIDCLVEYEQPLMEPALGERSAIAELMARYVSSLIEDGSTVQAGFGRVVASVLRCLDDKNDLGVHSEIISDSHLHLVRKGVITGAKKSIHRGKIVTSMCAGSRELYDFVDDNPQVEFYPTEYINHSQVISQNHRMVAINSALEIDLSGQVCADSIGHKIYSGIGGYVDFMVGASCAPEGKTIIVLPSTSPNGRKSRIVSHLTGGGGVVCPRSTVQYIVTEFGIASMYGKTLRERALSLINIAHPKFREKLLEEAKQLRYVFADQILPPIYEPLYPGQWETRATTSDGREIIYRPIKPTDERALQEFFYSLPDQDIYYRFLSTIKVFPHRNTQAMCNIDYESEMAIVAVTGEIGNETIVGIGRYLLDRRANMAEVDFAVRNEWQGKGIGAFLLRHLCEIAEYKGIKGFTAFTLLRNRPMQRVFRKMGFVVRTQIQGDVLEIAFRFDEPEVRKEAG